LLKKKVLKIEALFKKYMGKTPYTTRTYKDYAGLGANLFLTEAWKITGCTQTSKALQINVASQAKQTQAYHKQALLANVCGGM